jgi:hypothetical protein
MPTAAVGMFFTGKRLHGHASVTMASAALIVKLLYPDEKQTILRTVDVQL